MHHGHHSRPLEACLVLLFLSSTGCAVPGFSSSNRCLRICVEARGRTQSRSVSFICVRARVATAGVIALSPLTLTSTLMHLGSNCGSESVPDSPRRQERIATLRWWGATRWLATPQVIDGSAREACIDRRRRRDAVVEAHARARGPPPRSEALWSDPWPCAQIHCATTNAIALHPTLVRPDPAGREV